MRIATVYSILSMSNHAVLQRYFVSECLGNGGRGGGHRKILKVAQLKIPKKWGEGIPPRSWLRVSGESVSGVWSEIAAKIIFGAF